MKKVFRRGVIMTVKNMFRFFRRHCDLPAIASLWRGGRGEANQSIRKRTARVSRRTIHDAEGHVTAALINAVENPD